MILQYQEKWSFISLFRTRCTHTDTLGTLLARICLYCGEKLEIVGWGDGIGYLCVYRCAVTHTPRTIGSTTFVQR